MACVVGAQGIFMACVAGAAPLQLGDPFPLMCESLAFAKQNVRHKPIRLLTETVSTCSNHHLCKAVFILFPPYYPHLHSAASTSLNSPNLPFRSYDIF